MRITIVKIGGAVIDSAERLEQFLTKFASIPGAKILVHGGGREGSRISERLGIEPVMINGRRVTSGPALDVVTMVYAGLINKRITAMLQHAGCHGACGLSGTDANLMSASRRGPLDGVDYGFVGDLKPSGVNRRELTAMLERGVLPVVSPITHDGHGQLLNTNADTVASCVARAMSEAGHDVSMVFCFEQPGVLDNDKKVIPAISYDRFQTMKYDGTVNGGMIPKLEGAFAVAADGAAVSIKMAEDVANPDAGTSISI